MNQHAPGQDWIAIVRKHGTAEFGKAFAPNPTLDASVLNGPCVGVEAIAAFFAATSGGMYETIEFTHEATNGRKTDLEWQGQAFGKHVGGATILTRNNEDLTITDGLSAQVGLRILRPEQQQRGAQRRMDRAYEANTTERRRQQWQRNPK